MRGVRPIVSVLPLLAVALAAAAPASAATTTYGGSTKLGDAIVLTADAKGRSISRAVIAFRAPCDSGQRYAFHAVVPVTRAPGGHAPARASGGAFPLNRIVTSRNGGGRVTGVYVAATRTDAGSAILRMDFSARLTRTGARGTISVLITEWDKPGALPGIGPPGAKVVDRCRTGSVAWTAAHRPGRVYGGSTSQGEPLVLILNARRTAVSSAGVGWHASCTPSGFVDFPDALRNFPLRRGRFGDTFTWRPSGATIAYAFSGRVARRSASGRLDVRVRSDDGRTCRTGRLTWSAASR